MRKFWCSAHEFDGSILCTLIIIIVVITIYDAVVIHCNSYYITATNIQTGIVDGFLKLVISHAQTFNDRTKRDLSFKFKHFCENCFNYN